jgi:hypothetical protein
MTAAMPPHLTHAVCPACRTEAGLTVAAVDAGGYWTCSRCSHAWDSIRLATNAAYNAWAAHRPATIH